MTKGRREFIAWRKRVGLSQTQLAARLGVSVAYVNLIERGNRRPGPETMAVIADVTGVPMHAWLEAVAVTDHAA